MTQNGMRAKAELALAILRLIEDRRLTQIEAAQILGTDQARISKLKRGRELRRFTFDHLMDWLIKLDQNVTLTVKQKSQKKKMAIFKSLFFDSSRKPGSATTKEKT